MALSVTDRLDLTRWSSKHDSPTRAQFNANYANVGSKAAGFLRGTLASRPAASGENVGFLYEDADSGKVYWSNGATWHGPLVLMPPGSGDLLLATSSGIQALPPGSVGDRLEATSEGISWGPDVGVSPLSNIDGPRVPLSAVVSQEIKEWEVTASTSVYTVPDGHIAFLGLTQEPSQLGGLYYISLSGNDTTENFRTGILPAGETVPQIYDFPRSAGSIDVSPTSSNTVWGGQLIGSGILTGGESLYIEKSGTNPWVVQVPVLLLDASKLSWTPVKFASRSYMSTSSYTGYTVPAGKRAFIGYYGGTLWNTTGGALTAYAALRVGGQANANFDFQSYAMSADQVYYQYVYTPGWLPEGAEFAFWASGSGMVHHGVVYEEPV